jgi:hypothetical protein
LQESIMSRGRLGSKQVVTSTVVLALAFGSYARLAARDGDAPAAGSLAVVTEPAGAAIYVDGELAGQSPVTLEQIPAGDHRVRLVKSGYLEHGRVVTVGAGRTAQVNAKLTASSASAATSATAAAVSPGSKKWIWIGAAAGGATAAALLLRDTNKAPTLGGITASPGTGLQAATSIQFSAQGAQDPDSGDTLTYSWEFGDNTTSDTQNPSHVYTQAGTFDVKLTVSDGKKSASATTTVTIRSMTGTWTGSVAGVNVTLTLTQNGSNVTGTYRDDFGPGTLSGTVQSSSPRVQITVTQFGLQFTFRGDPDGPVNAISGSVTNFFFDGTTDPFTIRR